MTFLPAIKERNPEMDHVKRKKHFTLALVGLLGAGATQRSSRVELKADSKPPHALARLALLQCFECFVDLYPVRNSLKH